MSHATRRVVAPALEELLYQPIPVLDKGFVRVIDYMGDDQAIVQAARVSYGAGTRTVRSDAGLIDYLMRHQHTSPFEMCDIKLHVKLPVFVARQWIRHRTASVNEYSGRYSEIADTFYEPEPAAIGRQSAPNRQGSAGAVSAEAAERATRRAGGRRRPGIRAVPGAAVRRGRRGRPRGGPHRAAASATTPSGTGRSNLHNLLRFLELRMDEPRAVRDPGRTPRPSARIVAAWVPLTWASFLDQRFGSVTTLVQGRLACCGPSWLVATWTSRAPACPRVRRVSCASRSTSCHREGNDGPRSACRVLGRQRPTRQRDTPRGPRTRPGVAGSHPVRAPSAARSTVGTGWAPREHRP